MKRVSINPSDWGKGFFLDQGEVVEGDVKRLRCSGQTSIVQDPESPVGVSVVSPNDVREQLKNSLANVDAVLDEAGMTRSDIVFIRFYSTDADSFLQNYDVYAGWIADANITPPQTFIGVDRLILPGLVVEIEVEAAK